MTRESANRRDLPRHLAGFRGLHAGATAVVCGCGASLTELSDPERFLTVGVNDVGRIFQPTYLVVLNPRSQFKGDRFRYVEESGARAIFTQLDLGLRHPHVVRFKLGPRGGTDLSDPERLPCTRNSPYVALALAAFMGARRIGLIGVDFTDHHFFAPTGRHPLERSFAQIDREYSRFGAALGELGVEVVNLSRSSRLTAFPKVPPSRFAAAAAGPPAAPDRDLLIVQVAKTHCAGAIWRLHEAINRHTRHTCRTVTPGATTSGRRYPTDLLFRQRVKVREVLARADVIHFHNFIDPDDRLMAPYRELISDKARVLQYHSEPRLVERAFPGKDVVGRSDIRTLVIAQKHARFYPRSVPVPNVIDIFDPRLTPDGHRLGRGALKLLYAPTDRRRHGDYHDTCSGKGFHETLPILERLTADGLIELTVVDSMPWEELMARKRRHDVFVDEVVTGGYHLSSLEALSQGLVTIAHLDAETRAVLHRIVGEETELPWCTSTLATLEDDLRRLCALPPADLQGIKDRGRRWMEERWHPVAMIEHFLRAYGVPGKTRPRAEERRAPAAPEPPRGGRIPVDVLFRQVRLLPVYHRPPWICRSLSELEGAWTGRQVVIWGTGPSALEAPQVWEGASVHVGVNGALGHPRDTFDAYCLSDQRFVDDPRRRWIAENAPGVRVYLAHMRDVLPPDLDVNYVRTRGRDGFCSDLTLGAYHGLSVVWVALQLALWGGARDILLVGCEHDYRKRRMRSYDEEVPSPVDERNWPLIRANYQRLAPILERADVTLRTVGRSRLQEAGVPPWDGPSPRVAKA